MGLFHHVYCLILVSCAASAALSLDNPDSSLLGQDRLRISCADISSCGACRNTSLCHWCSDQQCHVQGSIHGCVYGTYCYDNDQCRRKEPEYRGYAAPSIAVLMGVFLVGSVAVTCGVATLSVAREYVNQSAASRTIVPTAPPQSLGDEYLMLSGNDCGSNVPTSTTEGESRITGLDNKRRRNTTNGSKTRRSRRRPEGPGPSPLARKVQNFTRFVCGTTMLGVLTMCVIVVAFAPHAPGVNVCNTQFDWGSILNSIAKAGVEADFQILISIYNPNMLDAELETGTAKLYHKHVEVGTMVFTPIRLNGGYITDTLVLISFDAETWQEAQIGLEYETGTLAFLMDATISASVLWHGLKTYPFTFSIHDYYIKVSDAVGYDRSLCNCPEMMQVRPPPITLPYLSRDGESDRSLPMDARLMLE